MEKLVQSASVDQKLLETTFLLQIDETYCKYAFGNSVSNKLSIIVDIEPV